MERLPDDSALDADGAGVQIGADPVPWIGDLGGRVVWRGARIAMRHATALFEGEQLPPLDFSVQGVSHLFEGPEQEHILAASAAPLPGLSPLLSLLASDESVAEAPAPPPPESPSSPASIRLEIDRPDHPALRWPLRDALVQI